MRRKRERRGRRKNHCNLNAGQAATKLKKKMRNKRSVESDEEAERKKREEEKKKEEKKKHVAVSLVLFFRVEECDYKSKSPYLVAAGVSGHLCCPLFLLSFSCVSTRSLELQMREACASKLHQSKRDGKRHGFRRM